MIIFVILGVVVLISLTVVFSRAALARSEQRSIRGYEHALEVLGDVSRRSDAPAHVRPLPSGQRARAHVVTDDDVEDEPHHGITVRRPASEGAARTPRPDSRARIEAAQSRFEDDSDAFERSQDEAARETDGEAGEVPAATATALVGAESSRPPSSEAPTRRPTPGSRSSGAPPRASRATPAPTAGGPGIGRATSIAAAVLVTAGVIVVGVKLASGSGKHHPDHSATGTTRAAGNQGHGATGSTATTTTPTTQPAGVVPTSSTPTDVVYRAPAGNYQVQFSGNGGPCWLGIQQVSGGPYLWQDSLNSGQSTSYSASGQVVITVGAPKYIAIRVNGLPVQLPANVQPYDVTLSPSA